MATYEKCPAEVYELMQEILEDQYPELLECEVSIGLVFAHAARDAEGNPKGPALKHGGYPAGGVVRRIGLKQRALGYPDAEIVLDGDQWNDWPEKTRRSLLDHELMHLIVKTNKKGQPELDDLDRPKLLMKLHDWQIGGFAEIVRRYGEFSLDQQVVNHMVDSHGQLLFAWMGGATRPTAAEANIAGRVGGIAERAASMVNAGALGPGVTATVRHARA